MKREIWLFSEISNYELKRIYDQSDPFEGADDKLKKNTLISYSSTDVWEAKNNIFFSQATGCMVSMSIMIRWYFYVLFWSDDISMYFLSWSGQYEYCEQVIFVFLDILASLELGDPVWVRWLSRSVSMFNTFFLNLGSFSCFLKVWLLSLSARCCLALLLPGGWSTQLT